MKITRLILLAATVAVTVLTNSCNDSKSYAELLTTETHHVNEFLADQRVSNTIPTDTNFVFETGENAPYYRLDEDGNMYMQVIDAGTKGNYVKEDETIFFRYTRYDLSRYADGKLPDGMGNEENMGQMNTWFRYNNYSIESSSQWGSGIQTPLKYLPIDAVVNIVIKSQYGLLAEQSYVVPFLYRLRYYRQLT